jgi:hypothetical protein
MMLQCVIGETDPPVIKASAIGAIRRFGNEGTRKRCMKGRPAKQCLSVMLHAPAWFSAVLVSDRSAPIIRSEID